MTCSRNVVRFGVLFCTLLSGACLAQQTTPPSFTAKAIQVAPLTGDDKREIVLMSVSIVPGGAVPLHTHPGDCVGAVVEGTVELLAEGQAPRKFSAGDSYSNLRGTPHSFRNVGNGQARLLNNVVADKGVPRTQMVQPAGK